MAKKKVDPGKYRGGCLPKLAPGGCRRDCLHRKIVEEYRDARLYYDLLAESGQLVDAGFSYGATVEAFRLSSDELSAWRPPLTFKQFLIDRAKMRDYE